MRHVPQKRQTLFFSATIDKKIKKVAYDLVRNAIRIQISPKNPVAKNVSHAVAYRLLDSRCGAVFVGFEIHEEASGFLRPLPVYDGPGRTTVPTR